MTIGVGVFHRFSVDAREFQYLVTELSIEQMGNRATCVEGCEQGLVTDAE